MSHDDKHDKKAQLKKNRKQLEIFTAFRLMRGEAERVKQQEVAHAETRINMDGSAGEPIWSEKVSSIRNRLTGKKRDTKERWNRFAGTSSGGGRGL